MAEERKVTFKPKSEWQKDDCINNHADHTCTNESTLEAVCVGSSPGTFVRIRCCEQDVCKQRAAELALSTVEHEDHQPTPKATQSDSPHEG